MRASDSKRQFIELSIRFGALKFGEFTLKSGRVSPYFFNAGVFSTGEAMATLGACYADAAKGIIDEIDGLFGPAYKGIPLATATGLLCSKVITAIYRSPSIVKRPSRMAKANPHGCAAKR